MKQASAASDDDCTDCSLNYDDLVCNGFYDISGDFPDATRNDNAFPGLGSLRSLASAAADSREVWLHTSAKFKQHALHTSMRLHAALECAKDPIQPCCLLIQVVLVNHDNDPNLLALDEAAVEAIANSIASYGGNGQRVAVQVCNTPECQSPHAAFASTCFYTQIIALTILLDSRALSTLLST